jgi:hypothetical protein
MTDNDLFMVAFNNLKLSMTPPEAMGGAPAGGAPAPAPGMPPGAPPAGGAPVDPATGMPMDPAAAGGAPASGMPVDPATGMPIDPATGAPAEDPLVKMIEDIYKEVQQSRKMIAMVLQHLQIQPDINELLESGEDPVKDAPKESYDYQYEGFASEPPADAIDVMFADPADRLSAAARVAVRHLSRGR